MKREIIFIFSLLTFLSYSLQILATTDYPNDSIKSSYIGDEIIIEAFKQNNHFDVKPIAATMLTSKGIKEHNMLSIKDITAVVPNLFTPDYGVRMTSPVFIRGIGSRINSPSVGLYIDGVPYFDRSAFDFNMNDVDRIEVLRGPQGTIYGRNTMGGIINVFTKSPFRYKETNLSLSAGNHNNYRVDASHYGKVNDKFGYSFSGNYMYNEGYRLNSYTGKKADNMDATSARLRLSWKIRPRLSAHLTSTYEYSDQDGYPYGIYNEDNNTVSDVHYDGRSYYRRNMSTTGLGIEYVTDEYKLSSQSSFQYFDGKQGIDQDFTEKANAYVFFDQRQQMYSQEAIIKSISPKQYKWLFGAFGFYQNYSTNNDINMIPTAVKILNNANNPSMGVAIYHQSTIDNLLIKGLSLELGVRYDWEKIKMRTNESNFKDGSIVTIKDEVKAEDTYSQFTPKASLQYTILDKNIIYASVARGYKSGGFNTNASEEDERVFKPEHSWSYELGTKWNILNGVITSDFTLFYIDWSDQQISPTRAKIAGQQQGYLLYNVDKSTSKGVEFSSTIRPIKQLEIGIGYGYTHAKFDKYVIDDTKDYSGKFLPLVPRHTVSLSANYSIDLSDTWLDRIMLNGQYTGIGKLYWNESNSASQPYYNTVNGKISFIKRNISVDLWVKNITNEKYINYYFTLNSGTSFAQRSKPFTCGVNLNLTF